MSTMFLFAGNNHVRNPNVPGGLSQVDNKTLQWFGASVSASLKDGGPILVRKFTDFLIHHSTKPTFPNICFPNI